MIKSKRVTDNLTVSDFKDARFMMAANKLKIAKAWERFVRGRCASNPERPTFWTKILYSHFHMHLGYIAHFNIAGFYEAQWRSPDQFRRNVEMLARNQTSCGPLHSGAWGANVDYEDLGRWIVNVACAYREEVRARCAEELKCAI